MTVIKHLPDLFTGCVCFYFHFLPDSIQERAWAAPCHPHSPDISHSHGVNEEICKQGWELLVFGAPLGGGCRVKKKRPKPISGY